MKTVITLVVEHYKPITDLAEKAAQRTYTLDGVNNAQVVLSQQQNASAFWGEFFDLMHDEAAEQPSDAPQQVADVTIYMDAGDLRQVLNGNDMPAWCSTTEARGTVKLATQQPQPAEQGEDAARWLFILDHACSGKAPKAKDFDITYVPAGQNGSEWGRIEIEWKPEKWAHITAADVNAVIDAARASQSGSVHK